jgi:hypothetical protein
VALEVVWLFFFYGFFGTNLLVVDLVGGAHRYGDVATVIRHFQFPALYCHCQGRGEEGGTSVLYYTYRLYNTQ